MPVGPSQETCPDLDRVLILSIGAWMTCGPKFIEYVLHDHGSLSIAMTGAKPALLKPRLRPPAPQKRSATVGVIR